MYDVDISILFNCQDFQVRFTQRCFVKQSSSIISLRTDQQALDIEAAGRIYLESYLELTRKSIAMGKLAWVVVPKWHAMVHVLVDEVRNRRLNPRYKHTFSDEDAMKVLKHWCRQAPAAFRSVGISRFSRLRMKTLEWKLDQGRRR